MVRRSTWLVVGALAAIALAAVVDALRGDEAGAPSAASPTTSSAAPTTEAPPAEPVADQAAFGGVLYYTDESCELRALRLPTLDPEEAPNWDECRFVLSPDGTRASGAGSGWDLHSEPRRGRLFQSEGATIQVSTNGGPEGEPIGGTAPAWRPTGTLAYAAGGAVFEWPTGRVVLSARDLAVAARAHPEIPASGRVRALSVGDLEWLDDDRIAVVLGVPVENAVEHAVAVFEGRRLAWVEFGGPRALFDLRVSANGRFLAATDGERLLLFDGRRGLVETPPFDATRIYGIAWSPDEQWAAVAADSSVYLFRPGEPQPRLRRLPIAARDLAWRGETEPAPLVSTEAAREWLGGAGATGRLFVTEPTCRLSAMRLPTLEWENEPAREPASCRFTLGPGDEPLSETIALSAAGDLRARCSDGRILVSGAGIRAAEIQNACAPAWTPDGRLTFVRDGELWLGTAEPRLLLTRAELREMFGRDARLEEVAWLDDRRVWAVIRADGRLTLAAMTMSDLVYSPTFTAERIDRLRVSSTGMVAAATDRGVVFFDNGGRRAMSFPGATAVAWAPDSVIAAVAAPRQILFVAPISREVVALPLPVEDLEWVVP